MKVQLTCDLVGVGESGVAYTLPKGDVIDLPAKEARCIVENGAAKFVDPKDAGRAKAKIPGATEAPPADETTPASGSAAPPK